MESDRVLPVIGLLKAISPDPSRPDKDTLSYPQLRREVRRQRAIEEVLLNTFYAAEDQSSQQLTAAHKLAEYELIETASALQRAQTLGVQRALSEQFTKASVDLFGAPDKIIATFLLEQLLTELCVLQTNYHVDAQLLDGLLRTYGDALAQTTTPGKYWLPLDETAANTAAANLGDFLRQRYVEALDVFAGEAEEWLSAGEIASRFRRALSVLQSQDASWKDWRVLHTNDSCLSVNSVTKRLVVGKHRVDVQLGELQGLFGHEVLVHALRASNGQHLSHEFETGLPGYIDAEEGFGCFVEHALSGKTPAKMYDRYLDVAMALGTIDGQPRSRRELFELVSARSIVRAEAAEKGGHRETIEREAWAHVNRIFRGTLGNEIVGVFTKDIAYYQGYQKIGAYIVEELREGNTIEELWTLLTLGKFDPTDASHILQLARGGEA